MTRSRIGWITLSLPILSALLQGGSCGPIDSSTPDLTVKKTGQGTVACDPNTDVYNLGDQVTLTATASAGWLFDHWEGDLTGNTNPATLTIDGAKTVTAVFVEDYSGCTVLQQTKITTDTTIPAGCYLVNDNIEVSNNAVLTLAPGVRLVFAEDRGLYVGVDGGLNAAGTAASPITLTGQTKSRGYWAGLRIKDSSWTTNVLQYATVEWAGQYSSGWGEAGLVVAGSAKASISHCTLSDSLSYGFGFYDTPTITFDTNTVTRNKKGAGYVSDASLPGVLTTTSSYTGNDADFVEMGSGSTSGNTTTDQTWHNLGAAYLIHGWLTVDRHLTLQPGARLVFLEDAVMKVATTGTLTAQGTADQPITLTGDVKSRGRWTGLRFQNSDVAQNVLQYVTIEYAGQNASGLGAAALGATGNTKLSVSHCTLSDSVNYGFSFYDTPTITFDSNTVTRNKVGAGYLESALLAGIVTRTSTYTGNDVDVVEMGSGSTSGSTSVTQTWDDLGGASFLIHGWLTVDSKLTLAPGARLVFVKNAAMLVTDAGSLYAVGTEAKPIVMTGQLLNKGHWGGLRFKDSASTDNQLQYVTVEYCGQGLSGLGNAICSVGAVGTTKVNIQHCTIQHGAGYGLQRSNKTNQTASDNTFVDNNSGDEAP